MSGLELTAALCGLLSVVLLVRRSTWNYPFAVAMVSLYGSLFFREKLYSDALLQFFFLIVNLWGWRSWLRAEDRDGAVLIRTLTGAARGLWAAGWLGGTACWGWMMARHTDASYPWPDAAIAIGSVIAQVLLIRRYLENWALWIAIDLASLPLYAAKGLYLTVLLYVLLLLLSIAGWRSWLRAARAA